MAVKTGRKRITIDPRRLILLLTLLVIIAAVAVAAGRHMPKYDHPSLSAVAHASSDNGVKGEKTSPAGVQGENAPSAGTETADGERQEGSRPAPASSGGKEPVSSPGIATGEINYRAIFDRDLFMGDSITEGLSFYEYVDESDVIAELGLTLAKAGKELDRVARANPERIFLLFGTNDISATVTDERFLEEYRDFIRALEARVPQAKIYVQSILPVSSKVEAARLYLNRSRIDRLNKALGEMAARERAGYLDLAPVLKEAGRDLHEPDGIHFTRDFYPLWLNRLIRDAK